MWRFPLACFVIGIGSVQSLVTPASRSIVALRPPLHEGPPFALSKGKHACNLFGDPYFYNGDAKLAKQDAAARKAFLGQTRAVEVLKYGDIMSGFQSTTINSARVRSYVNTFRSRYRWEYGMLWEIPPGAVHETMEQPEFYKASKGVSSSIPKPTTKPTLSNPANTRAVDFFANQYFYDDSQDAMNPAWAQLRIQTFGDLSVLEVLQPLKSQADLEKYFRVAINCWENVLDYTDLAPITDRLDRQQ
jgi:hypothetical protein